MAMPSGTRYWIPITANKTKTCIENNFLFQKDMSTELAGDPIFKSFIATTNNVTVYDVEEDQICYKWVMLDLTNNKLLIYFNAKSITSDNKEFWVCVGLFLNYPNHQHTFEFSGYQNYWPINEFAAGPAVADVAGIWPGTVIAPGQIGIACQFGNGFSPSGANGRISCGDVTTIENVQRFTFECLANRTASGIYIVMFRKYGGGIYYLNYMMLIDGGNTLTFSMRNYPKDPASCTWDHFLTLTVGWHHFAAIFDGTQADYRNRMKIYVDGVLRSGPASASAPTISPNTTNPLTFHADGYNDSKGCSLDEPSFSLSVRSGSFLLARSNMQINPATFWATGSGEYTEPDFVADHTTVYVGDIITFTNLSVMDVLFSLWQFGYEFKYVLGNGSTTYFYKKPGAYTVRLWVITNDYEILVKEKINYITVRQRDIDFIGTPRTGTVPAKTKFSVGLVDAI